jgi:hypothetical protein
VTIAAPPDATSDVSGYFDLAIALGRLSGHVSYLLAFADRLGCTARTVDIASITAPCSVAELGAALAGVADTMDNVSPLARELEVAISRL